MKGGASVPEQRAVAREPRLQLPRPRPRPRPLLPEPRVLPAHHGPGHAHQGALQPRDGESAVLTVLIRPAAAAADTRVSKEPSRRLQSYTICISVLISHLITVG